MSGDAESDSVDSLICACGSPMLMRFLHSHAILPCSGRYLTLLTIKNEDYRCKMAYIQGDGKDRISNKAD